jgi:protein-S-isoprenylcysteine O-methyltransferase Ste14
MSSLLFNAFLILVGAAIIFYFAGDLAGHGSPVAANICASGGVLCRHPEYVALAALGAGILWFSQRADNR